MNAKLEFTQTPMGSNEYEVNPKALVVNWVTDQHAFAIWPTEKTYP